MIARRKVYYCPGNAYWIRVHDSNRGGCTQRATTNEPVWRAKIDEELDYRRSVDEAQADLEAFAARHNLTEVPEKYVYNDRS